MEISKYAGRIIDTHAHVYPDKIASKAVQAISDFYSIPMVGGNGSLTELMQRGAKNGIGRFVIHSLATTPHQVQAINNFILGCADTSNSLIPFMTLHPSQTEEEMRAELDRVIPLGMKGVKLHPDFQKFKVDDDESRKIYEAIDGRLPILFHAGDNRYDFSGPRRIANVAKMYPSQTIIAAHFGGYRQWDDVEVYRGLENVVFDTCSSLAFITQERAYEIMKELGFSRFMFASDYPMWNYEEELVRFSRLPLDEKQTEDVLFRNAERLLGL